LLSFFTPPFTLLKIFLVGAKKYKGTTYPHSFYGSDFIDWICDEEKIDRERGRNLAQSLLDSGFQLIF
jgi:hypothetical protein